MPVTILLLVAVGAPDALGAPHHGGKSANPSWLYSWARPRTVVVSQRPPAPGTTDALTPLERAGTPVLRTWQRGTIHFRWTPDASAGSASAGSRLRGVRPSFKLT